MNSQCTQVTHEGYRHKLLIYLIQFDAKIPGKYLDSGRRVLNLERNKEIPGKISGVFIFLDGSPLSHHCP
jgi:hypothetical protein